MPMLGVLSFALLVAPAGASDDLAVRLAFRAGPEIVLQGDAELDGDVLTVRRAGGNGRRLYDDIVGPLLAAGWTTTGQALAEGERPGVSRTAVSLGFRRGDQALKLDLFDAGYGQESVAALAVQYAGVTHGVVGPGLSLPLAGEFTLYRSEACQGAGDPDQVAASWTAALSAGGWVPAPGGWLERGGRQLRVEAQMSEACAQLDVPLPERWTALGLPTVGVMVTHVGKASVQLRLGDAHALERWLSALDATLLHAGWTRGPAARPGSRSYTRPGDHLSVSFGATEEGTAYVGLVAAPRWSQPDLGIALALPGGPLPLLGSVETLGATGVSVWRRDESPDDGALALLAAAEARLRALGWSAQAPEPGRVTFARGADRVALTSGSGLDPQGQGATALLTIELAPSPPSPPGAKAPRASPAAPPSPPFSFVLTVPGGQIAVSASGARANDGALCLEDPDVAAGDMDAALSALGWRALPQAGWYAREGKHARVLADETSTCIVMDVPVAPAWAGVVDAGALVTACSDDGCSTEHPELAAGAAARDRAVAELVRRGWAESAPPRDVTDDPTLRYEERRYALGDEEITLGLLEAGSVTTLELTRRGPPGPW